MKFWHCPLLVSNTVVWGSLFTFEPNKDDILASPHNSGSSLFSFGSWETFCVETSGGGKVGGGAKVSLTTVVVTVKLGFKELFGHHKKVP